MVPEGLEILPVTEKCTKNDGYLSVTFQINVSAQMVGVSSTLFLNKSCAAISYCSEDYSFLCYYLFLSLIYRIFAPNF